MKIYIAGPEVFLPNAKEIGEEKKQICKKYDHVGYYPLDNDLESLFKSSDPVTIGLGISNANHNMMDVCDVIIANITPFRGPSLDVGTGYEMGYMQGRDKLVLAYTNCSKKFYERSKMYTMVAENNNEFNMLIENFNLIDNLMIDGSVEKSGFSISRMENIIPWKDTYTNLIGFENCVKQL